MDVSIVIRLKQYQRYRLDWDRLLGCVWNAATCLDESRGAQGLR